MIFTIIAIISLIIIISITLLLLGGDQLDGGGDPRHGDEDQRAEPGLSCVCI